MKRRIIWLVVSCVIMPALLLVSCTWTIPEEEVVKTEKEEIVSEEEGLISETLLAEIDVSSWIPDSMIISPDNQHVTYVAQVGGK